MVVHACMREEDGGSWVAWAEGRVDVRATGASADQCLDHLRRALGDAVKAEARGEPLTLVVRVLPRLVGVAEAAAVMGWDKRRVITYLDRGRFPPPLQALASGRVWLRSDVEGFAVQWRARRAARLATRGGRGAREAGSSGSRRRLHGPREERAPGPQGDTPPAPREEAGPEREDGSR
jgi:hypothetical protein